MRNGYYKSLKILPLGLSLVIILTWLLFNIACQDVNNPLGPSPEVTSTNNATQTSGTTSRDDFDQLKKPGPIIKTPPPTKPHSPGETKTANQPSPNFPAQTKGTISPSPFPPIQVNTDRLRPFRAPHRSKKTPKTLTTPVTTSPAPTSTDNEDEDGEKRPSQELHIQVSPDAWNFSWANSSGLLTVRLIGEGATNVDPETLTLSLTNEDDSLTTPEIKPLWAKQNDSHILAKFKKNEAIALLPEEAQAGDTFLVVIKGQFQSENGDGQEFEPLTDMIRVVGQNKHHEDEEDEYLTIKLTPRNWNPAWALSLAETDDDGGQGYVIAHFKGDGLQDIIQGSITLTLGTCDEAMGASIMPVLEELDEGEDEYLAYFEKSEAIGLIPEPKPGETYQVSVRVQLNNADSPEYCQTFTIKIVGKSHELTVKIKPDRWNISWWKANQANNNDNDETIKIIFKGLGFDQIALDSVEITYNGNSVGSSAIAGSDLDEDDSKLVVEFKRSEVIKLITDPKVGQTYTLAINFSLDGTATSLEVSIFITGKKK